MKYPPGLVEAMARGIDPGSRERLGRNPNSSGYEAGVIASLRKARAALDALVAALPAAGCKIVQREPTEEMLTACEAAWLIRIKDKIARGALGEGQPRDKFVANYRVMFDAAPAVPDAWQNDATLPPPPPR